MNRIALGWLLSLIVACIVLVSCAEKPDDKPSGDPETTKSSSVTETGEGGSSSTTMEPSDEESSGGDSSTTESTAYMTDEWYWETFTYPDGYEGPTDENYWVTYLPDEYWATYSYDPDGFNSTMANGETIPTAVVTNPAGQTVVITVPVITATNQYGSTIVVPAPIVTTNPTNAYEPPQNNSSSSAKTTKTTSKTVPVVTGAGNKQELNVLDYGVDNTGKKDMTDKLTAIHAMGKRVYYPNGTYLFNGKTLDFSGGVRFESKNGVVIRNSISSTPIVNFDDKGNLIGLMHNHLEYTYDRSGVDTIGNLVSPPLSAANYNTKVDLLPYWYNDFGRYSQLSGKSGWRGWYSWQWNHHNCKELGQEDPYDPNLHPLLGWYRGDEVEVLDWQCYWLREYGVGQAALLADSASSDRSSGSHWVYNLLHKTPNAQKMKFAMQGYAPDSFKLQKADYTSAWDDLAEWYYCSGNYDDQIYCYEENGKQYPIVFVWNENAMRYNMGHNLSTVVSFYKRYAQMFQEAGWDGICIMSRTVHSIFASQAGYLADMNAAGVEWFASEYAKNAVTTQSSYEATVNSFSTLTNTREWYTVAVGLHTHSPHPSDWNCPGNTPTLFGKWLQKAVNATTSNKRRAKIVTCYNISEWSEGSAGLVPTVGSRFGYLEAIYDAVVK